MENIKRKYMKDFFPIETPYDSEDYKLMQAVTKISEGFTKSEFKKSSTWANKFLWNIHTSELPTLYKNLEEMYKTTGNNDYESLLSDIKNAAPKLDEATISIKQEMLDPFDPMDANQTITGHPTKSSDLGPADEFTMDEAELKEMIRRELYSLSKEGIESAVDNTNNTIVPPQTEMDESDALQLNYENDSDALRNQHGMNAKPSNLVDETTDTEKFEDVVFMQGEEADEPLSILKNAGPEAAIEYMKQWHNPGQHMGSNEQNHGASDKTFEKDGYILSWNPHLNYIGLQHDTEHGLDEDSLAMRHRAGQRGKIGNTPLGQHAPHSQAAIKENKK